VGKTFLVRRTFEDRMTFQLTGLADVTMGQQLTQFHAAMLRHAPVSMIKPADSWTLAFQQLSTHIDYLPADKKKVIFLDELPWLATPRSGFISALEHFWNSWASARDDILLIVCGSAASWMLENMIHNKGGLHNRITDQIHLKPFTLVETEEFLISKGVRLDRYQILLLYMAFGGIPFYLDKIEPGQSAMQNIDRLCFHPNAPFRIEFELLFASLFSSHKRHMDVVMALSTKRTGLSREEISSLSGLTNAGSLTRILEELEACDFIRRFRAFGKKVRDSVYQLTDPYSLFFTRFILESHRDDENYWLNLTNSPKFYAWAGISFEMICLLHISQIKQSLGIGGVQTSVSAWSGDGAQIDLIIDRKDHVINLCEMKFSINEFEIDKAYSENLRNKLEAFRASTQTK